MESLQRRWLRIRLLRDPTLVSELLTAFVRIVFADHRRRARALGLPGGHAGAVTAVQRFGSFLNAKDLAEKTKGGKEQEPARPNHACGEVL